MGGTWHSGNVSETGSGRRVRRLQYMSPFTWGPTLIVIGSLLGLPLWSELGPGEPHNRWFDAVSFLVGVAVCLALWRFLSRSFPAEEVESLVPANRWRYWAKGAYHCPKCGQKLPAARPGSTAVHRAPGVRPAWLPPTEQELIAACPFDGHAPGNDAAKAMLASGALPVTREQRPVDPWRQLAEQPDRDP